MARKIVRTQAARDQLRAIDRPAALRILHPLARLTAAGEGDVQRLQGIDPPEFRLRVGDYRVRFHQAGKSIQITADKHRRDICR